MKNYYIPDITEFYSGFRYEYLDNADRWVKSDEFTNDWDYEDNPHYAVLKRIPQEKIRVKYLDREDIEELGWVYEGLTNDNKTEIYGGIKSYTFYRIVCPNGESSIAIFKAIADKGEGNLFSGKDSDSSYYLKIKNYNELKTLMKQIGII